MSIQERIRHAAIIFLLAAPGFVEAARGQTWAPRETPVIVNGTDRIETPLYYHEALGFGRRVGFKIVEHGDTTFFQDDLSYLETAHIDWAAPYANGPVRVLFIANPQGQLRHPIELMQRSDFDVTVLQIPAVLDDGQDETHEKIRQRIFEIANRDYDVIAVTSAASPGSPLFDLLKAKVEAGCGAVVLHNFSQWWRCDFKAYQTLSPLNFGHQGGRTMPVRTAVRHPVTDGLSLACWPPTSTANGSADNDAEVLATVGGRPIVAVGTCGNGRTVGIYYHTQYWGGILPRPAEDAVSGFDDAHEPVYALFLRALAWAGGKAPRVRVNGPETVVFVAGKPTRLSVRVSETAVDLAQVVLRGRLRDPWGNLEADGLAFAALDGSSSELFVDLPALQVNGRHRLDWWAMNGDQVENWGCVAIRVEGGPELRVEPLQETATVGGTARYRVRADVPGSLLVQGVDDADRIFSRDILPLQGEAIVAVRLAGSRLPRNRVIFSLVRDGTVVARELRELAVPRLGVDSMQGEYCFAMYGGTPVDEHLARYVGDLYRAVGLNTFYANWHHRGRSRDHYLTGLHSISGAMSPYLKQSNFDRVLSACPNKPETRTKWLANITKATDDFRTYGGIGRVLDDEAFLAYVNRGRGAQVCQCEYCLTTFRDELRAKYGTVGVLNKAWSTDYSTWDDVRPLEEDDVADRDNPAGWLEFRVFMNHVYARRYYGWIQEQHADLGPSYGVGPGAPQHGGIYHGSNHALRPVLRFMMLYGAGNFPDAFMGAPGAQKYEPPLNWQQFGPWNSLLRGADALWFYYGHSIIGCELAWRRHATWIETGVRDIREGVGVLVRDAKPVQPQVQIYDSIQQEGMRWLFGQREDATRFLGQMTTASTLKTLLERRGIAVGVIAPDAIARGELDNGRLLVLSAATNMDAATADAIRDYVRGGGCVVADVLPAMREAMGKPREQSALGAVFGRVAGGEPRAGLPEAAGDDGVSGYTHRKVGAGNAILLDFVANDVNDETAAWYDAFADRLVGLAGLAAPARIVDAETRQPLPHRPLYVFTCGKATLLGSIRGYLTWANNNPRLLDHDADGPEMAAFTWPEQRHVYNVRNGEYLGFSDNATVDLPSFQARLLALLPYRVSGLAVSAPSCVQAGDRVTIEVRVRATGDAPGPHVFRLNVESPTGHHVPLYAQTRTGSDGRAVFTIPFAYNDRQGGWTLTVRDVLSGTVAQHTITVRR